MKKITEIHFVCTGNSYRSRLAEAYLKSKQLAHIRVSSSGIEAKNNYNGPITWYAARLAKHHGLVPFLKPTWTQTKPVHLQKAHLVVFMGKSLYGTGRKPYQMKDIKHEAWDIPDLHELGFTDKPWSLEEETRAIAATEETFRIIKQKIDELIAKLE